MERIAINHKNQYPWLKKNPESEIIAVDRMSVTEISRLVQELKIRQVELEMQNRKLHNYQKELIKERRKYADLYDFAPAGYITLNDYGQILEANLTAANQLGQEKKQLLNKYFYLFVVEDDRQKFKLHLNKIFETKTRQTCELKLFTNHNQEFHVRLESIVVKDCQNSLQCRTIIHDNNESVKAEQANENLLSKLKEKNNELEQIIYMASHDLRNPLVNIHGFSQELTASYNNIRSIICHDDIPEKVREKLLQTLTMTIPEALDYITSSTARMDLLISGLLRLSRLEQANLVIEPLNMNLLIGPIVEAFKIQIRKLDVTLQIDKVPDCKGDEIRINQVFYNLIDNALKYLDPNRAGFVRISGNRKNDQVIYCVEDNGIGIAADDQNKIWSIFYRINPGDGAGEGLGLTIVRKIINRHGGKIWVESEPGKGSKFFVALSATT